MLPIKALLILSSVASANFIVGVSPEKQDLYTPNAQGKWHCLSDASIELSYEQINDDFCDCPDGSDEPGTNACAFTKDTPRYFYCANEGYKEAYIENYKLNDGVCDYDICCDGSDEYKSGACPNVCGQVKAQFDEYLVSRKSAVQAALEAKKDLEKSAHDIKQSLVKSAESLSRDISQDEARLAVLTKELEQEQQTQKNKQNQAENTKKSASVASIIDNLVDEHSRKLEKTFSHWSDHSKKTSDRLQVLESMLDNLLRNYNPNFNDQAVKQTVSSYADYISNKPEAETDTPVLDITEFGLGHVAQALQEVIPNQDDFLGSKSNSDSASSIFGKLLEKSRSFFGNTPSIPDSPSAPPLQNSVSGPPSEKAEQISEQIRALEKDLQSKKSEESIYKDGLAADYGHLDIYRAVKGKWANKMIGEYNYRLGFLDALYQDNTLVGRFVGIQGTSMFYAHGSKCWNGPQRSARVDMVCGPAHDLISVSEPEKCQYRFLMSSPLACDDMTDEEIAKDFKVDRARLEL
ncbi:hypothetical protein JCM33374_g4033 [Metschnikowia sp. JCM 33374]|nr:hypothetical protein JCM33374_g4033 [Metschnikowia sp. JCM 33374]